MKLGVYVLLGVLACPGVAQTANHSPSDTKELVVWEPPQSWYPQPYPKPTVPRELVGQLHVANMDIVLEETRMKDVQARLGGSIGHRGDAGEYLEWVCVHGTDEIGEWALWIEGGEIHGGTVGGFQWQRVPSTAKFDKRCPTLSKADSAITLPIAIGLGTTEAELLRILGKTSVREGDNFRFAHQHEETIRGESYTSDNQVSVFVRKGTVWALHVWKTTTS